MFLRITSMVAILLLINAPSRVFAWEGCYQLDQPFTGFQGATPKEIEVYYDNTFSNAPSIGALSVAAAKNIAKSVFSRMPGESGANFTFRVMSTPPPVPTCDENSAERLKPYIIIFGDPDETFCCAATGTCGACGRNEFKGGSTEMKCGHLHFRLDVNYGYYSEVGNEFMRLLQHELGHVFRLEHQGWVGCPESNQDDVVTTCSPCAAAPIRRHLTRADRLYYRSDYGRWLFDMREFYGDFDPATWVSTTRIDSAVVGSGATTDGNDLSSGYVYNAHIAGFDDEVRAVLYESNWTGPETVSAWNSYYRPDVTRSIGKNPNKWLAAFLYNDSRENGNRDIRISEKTFGQAGWTETSLDANVQVPQIAATYDPLSQQFLLATLTNSDEIQIRSRPFAGGGWAVDSLRNGGGGPMVKAYDGADIACSAWANNDGHNCVAVFVTADTSSAIKYVPFHMSTGIIANGNVTSGDNLLGISRPSVTSNPRNEDPKFHYVFSQGGTTVFSRLQNRNTAAWYGGTPVVAPSQWAPPASVGSWDNGDESMSDLVVSQ